jgi:hypothetical protein
VSWDREVSIQKFGGKEHPSWRICAVDETGAPEEVVFTIQGIIVHCDLPPITKEYARCEASLPAATNQLTDVTRTTTARTLQQRVTLSGLGTASFQTMSEGIVRLNGYLRSRLREDQTPAVVKYYRDHPAFEFSNRYFTSARFAEGLQVLPISKDVDPDGYLENMKGDNMVHTTDNLVEYYERTVNKTGEQRYFAKRS